MLTKKFEKKRILVYGINFRPDMVGIAKYTGELTEWLVKHDFEVRVVTATSYFPAWKTSNNRYRVEMIGGTTVFRCPLWVPRKPNGITRLLHLASFAISSFPIVLWQARWHPDVILTVVPAFFCAPTSLLLKNICKSIEPTQACLHIQDFELDAAFELGILKGYAIRKMAESLEAAILKRFDYTSTISKAMHRRLIKKGVAQKNTFLFPNWVNTAEIYPQTTAQLKENPYRNELGIRMDQKVIMYSGSINKKQGLEILVETIKKMANDEKYAWIIAGEGPTKMDLVEQLDGKKNVFLLPLQEENKMNDWLNLADIHVIPQKKGAEDLVLPSKLLGILASGRPVVACTPHGTELGDIATLAGIRVDPGDSQKLLEAILTISENTKLANQCKQMARELAINAYDKEQVLKSFEEHLNIVIAGKRRGRESRIES